MIRNAVERCLPYEVGETKIEPHYRKYIFRGGYAKSKEILEFVPASLENNQFPNMINVVRNVRQKGSYTPWTSRGVMSLLAEPGAAEKVTADLNQEGIVKRASRVENIARRAKATVGIALICNAAFTAGETVTKATHSPIPKCEEVVRNGDTLFPATSEDITALQGIYGAICRVGEQNYFVAPSESAPLEPMPMPVYSDGLRKV